MKSVTVQAVLSRHARDRLATLRIDEEEVRITLRHPEATYPGGPDHPPGRVIVVGRFIIVVVAPEFNAIVTVKLRSAMPYSHGLHHRYNYPPNAGTSAA